jgi:hypothetical protein
MKRVLYRRPDSGEPVLAFALCATGESTLLFVPSFEGTRPDSLAIAHDDDLDGVFQDTEMNWFNVESSDLSEIVTNLKSLGAVETDSMKLLDQVIFRNPDGTLCRAWFYQDLGEAKILLVDRGPRQVTVEIGQDLNSDGIFERATNFSLDQEGEKALTEAKEFVAEALKPEEPK